MVELNADDEDRWRRRDPGETEHNWRFRLWETKLGWRNPAIGKLMLLVMAREADEQGYFSLSHAQFAAAVRCSPASIRTNAKRLFKARLIEVEPAYDNQESGGGGRIANRYRLLCPPPSAG